MFIISMGVGSYKIVCDPEYYLSLEEHLLPIRMHFSPCFDQIFDEMILRWPARNTLELTTVPLAQSWLVVGFQNLRPLQKDLNMLASSFEVHPYIVTMATRIDTLQGILVKHLGHVSASTTPCMSTSSTRPATFVDQQLDDSATTRPEDSARGLGNKQMISLGSSLSNLPFSFAHSNLPLSFESHSAM